MNTMSLNGRDGSGKSQQLRLLKWQNENRIHVTKPLISYSPRWPQLRGHAMSQWWFERVPVEELIEIIIESLNRRHRDRVSGKISMHDRGWHMFKAVCAATMLTRDEAVTLDEAVKTVDEQFAAELDHIPDEVAVLLEPDSDYFSKIDNLIKLVHPEEDADFPENSKIRYRRYQENLVTTMNVYFSAAHTHRIKVCGPIIDIQNRLRTLVSELGRLALPHIGGGIALAVGFGGLSGRGKRSFTDHIRHDHGFLRLKLRYFIEIIEGRGEKRTPESVALELLRFLDCHHYVQLVSFESLHDPHIPAMLKLMFGDRCKIAYIEASKDIRVSRGARELGVALDEATRIIDKKDRVKSERGAETVREFADIVFDNSANNHEQNLQAFANLLKT